MASDNKPFFKLSDVGTIPKDWEIKTIEDVTSRVCVGFVGTCFKDYCNQEHGVPMIRTTNLSESGIVYTNLKYVTKDFHLKNKKSQLVKGDIVVARHGDSGKACYYGADFDSNCLNIIVIRTDKDKCDPKFLLYSFRNPQVKRQIDASIVGSVQGVLNTKILAKILLPLPKLEEQILIGSIFSNIDSKIALNQEMNKVLEAIGQVLFKRWFVDFEFPNQEGKPYVSTGGKMAYNKELGKEVPADWEVITLEKVAEFTRGFSYSGAEKSAVNGELVFMTLNSIYEGGGFKREFSYLTSDRLKERHLVKEGDIIIANTEQTKSGTLLGFPALVEFPNEYSKSIGCFSHHITKVTPYKEEIKYYLYHYLQYNQSNAVKYHTGSVIWALDVAGFTKNEQIIIPDYATLRSFAKILNGIFKKKLLNNKQSKNLSSLRDNLLPKLMSGKIRVPVNKESNPT